MNEDFADPELIMLRNNKDSGYEYRKRRHEQWTENYTLYRDTVLYNRFTQRQAVNVPLMKQTIRTLLKDVDDLPILYFENLDNDKEAEIFKNEYWKYTGEENKFELFDLVDKKQVMFFGRSFDVMQIIDGKVSMKAVDPEDILVYRYTDPTNIDSTRYLIHTHIFTPLSVIEQNPDFDQNEVKELKTWHATDQGLVKAKANEQMLMDKNEKYLDLGIDDIQDPILGETTIELTLYFVMRKEDGDTEEQFYVYVEADDQVILMKKPLEEVIGVTKDHYWRNHLPYNTWADDLDLQDFWTDGVADIIRTPNKVLNTWVSQMVENRTLRSFGMNYYDGTAGGDGAAEFSPQTFQPMPFGWYKLPGKPSDVLQRVDIPDLSESLDEMQYITGLAEKASGATANMQGAENQKQITLGEVKIALNEAKARVKGMSKFYTQVWKERGTKFSKMLEAAQDKLDAVTIYKKGRNSNKLYSREIGPNDYLTESGYVCRVWAQDEKDTIDQNKIQKLNAVMTAFPGNKKIIEIYQRKMAEFGDLTPDEINEVMQLEEQKTSQDNTEADLSNINQNMSPIASQFNLPQASKIPQVPQ